jgi:hypothetical protein
MFTIGGLQAQRRKLHVYACEAHGARGSEWTRPDALRNAHPTGERVLDAAERDAAVDVERNAGASLVR